MRRRWKCRWHLWLRYYARMLRISGVGPVGVARILPGYARERAHGKRRVVFLHRLRRQLLRKCQIQAIMDFAVVRRRHLVCVGNEDQQSA